MDFGALPPEVNSALMYAGAGAPPLMTAASAWNGLADELGTAAASIESVITRLSTEEWVSAASLSMAAAAQPFVAWLTCTAEASAHAAGQAISSVAAYETAFAMTVPPAEVAANRAQLAVLTETNILGQNMPAIAATEARYSEMWARDAAAMYGYAASSAAAARLNPLMSPAEPTNPAGIANQAAAVAQAAASGSAAQVGFSELIAAGPDAVQSLAAPVAPGGIAEAVDLARVFDSAELPWLDGIGHNRATAYDYLMGLTTAGQNNEDAEVEEVAHAAAEPFAASAAAAHSARSAGTGATPTVAGLGNAHVVGDLSVPTSWSSSVPATTAAPAVDGTYWAVPQDDESFEGLPPAPGMVVRADSTGATPRYGVKPIVMPKQRLC